MYLKKILCIRSVFSYLREDRMLCDDSSGSYWNKSFLTNYISKFNQCIIVISIPINTDDYGRCVIPLNTVYSFYRHVRHPTRKHRNSNDQQIVCP